MIPSVIHGLATELFLTKIPEDLATAKTVFHHHQQEIPSPLWTKDMDHEPIRCKHSILPAIQVSFNEYNVNFIQSMLNYSVYKWFSKVEKLPEIIFFRKASKPVNSLFY